MTSETNQGSQVNEIHQQIIETVKESAKRFESKGHYHNANGLTREIMYHIIRDLRLSNPTELRREQIWAISTKAAKSAVQTENNRIEVDAEKAVQETLAVKTGKKQ